MTRTNISLAVFLLTAGFLFAEEPATIGQPSNNTWTLKNAVISLKVEFSDGGLAIGSIKNVDADIDYLSGPPASPLFSYVIHGAKVAANDGRWTLDAGVVSDIECYGRTWGKRLELTLSRTEPMPFRTRQVIELYNGRAGLRLYSWLKNPGDREITISESDVLALNLPDKPHRLHYIEGKLNWEESTDMVANGGRNCIGRYDTGDGWFVVPENNWATCLAGGRKQGDRRHKLLSIRAFADKDVVRVTTDPVAIQLVLTPGEEVEYFSVNLGVFKGDVLDGRVAVSEHLRKRFKFHDPSRFLSTNDWTWRDRRTDPNYRTIVIPKAAAAGFDRVHIDDFWYAPEDGVDPKEKWTDMASLCDWIAASGMKPGHWFSLHGKYCSTWGDGRDCADPQNVAFKKQQCEDVLIGRYHSAWDQVDAGLLWRTDADTAYSHPSDSVYRKILGLRDYMNTLAHRHPDLVMQTTCEIDNPMDGHQNENVGLIHLADNGIAGYYLRTDSKDNVRDMFDTIGLFPLEGMMTSWGEGGQADAWQDSPLWYYQFLLARHTSIYSWPGDWSAESVAHLRLFNDWRKNPRIKAVLNEVVRPVYNGRDWRKNEGPWCWSFTDEAKGQTLLLALNHLDIAGNNTFAAKLRNLDPVKTYLVEDITMLPGGKFNHGFRGEFTGAKLRTDGLPVDLDDGAEPCAAFWIQEKAADRAQLLYADAAVTSYAETGDGPLTVELKGERDKVAQLVVYKPAKRAVENRAVKLGADGKAEARFDAVTVNETPVAPPPRAVVATTAVFTARDNTTGGAWNGKFGALDAWIAGTTLGGADGFALRRHNATTYIWGEAEGQPMVLDSLVGQCGPDGKPMKKKAACWTAGNTFTMAMKPQSPARYKLSVYVMDYDVRQPDNAREMDIAVTAPDGRILDTQRAAREETLQGVYLSWTVTGPVTIEAKKIKGVNAAVSGVFIDAP